MLKASHRFPPRSSDRKRRHHEEAVMARLRDTFEQQRDVHIDYSRDTLTVTESFVQQVAARLVSSHPEIRRSACIHIRRILSIENAPPINTVIDTGCVPVLVSLLDVADDVDLQYEAAWAITNIASGNSTQSLTVVDANCVERFIRMVASSSTRIADQAIWALGNIAGDSPALRNYCLEAGAMRQLVRVLSQLDSQRLRSDITFVRNTAWAISNLCRGKPQPLLDHVRISLAILYRLLTELRDDESVVTDSLWAISYICDGPNQRIQALLDFRGGPERAPLLPILISFLGGAGVANSIVTPAVRACANIATGDDNQTQQLLQHGLLARCAALLTHPRTELRKELCWMLSNITAGSTQQIQQVIDAGVLPRIIHIIENDRQHVKHEAIYVLSNLASGGRRSQHLLVHELGGFAAMLHCCRGGTIEPRSMRVVLEGLRAVLEAESSTEAPDDRIVTRAIATSDLLGILDDLRQHEGEVGNEAGDLVDQFFNEAISDREHVEIRSPNRATASSDEAQSEIESDDGWEDDSDDSGSRFDL
ncbi:importin alpha [Capsaspora owczarzaki ATCC 30864]|uniref:Importin subunit alpha n=1 Tax=Capsaspora owczarzaki (strain ATCC 30864) TaxID=595528 RepID=A0A0D2VIE9_CAPO3|nr:importin alpha [Capsaspora owczarzaki ATCC 30864]